MSTSCLINSPRLKVWKRTGEGGPRHDPYGFTEYDIRPEGCASLKVHFGLLVWTECRGRRVNFYDDDQETIDGIIRLACGYTIEQLERFARKARSRCPCGSKSFTEARGYPGEYAVVCTECHRVASVTFNEAAVI